MPAVVAPCAVCLHWRYVPYAVSLPALAAYAVYLHWLSVMYAVCLDWLCVLCYVCLHCGADERSCAACPAGGLLALCCFALLV